MPHIARDEGQRPVHNIVQVAILYNNNNNNNNDNNNENNDNNNIKTNTVGLRKRFD